MVRHVLSMTELTDGGNVAEEARHGPLDAQPEPAGGAFPGKAELTSSGKGYRSVVRGLLGRTRAFGLPQGV